MKLQKKYLFIAGYVILVGLLVAYVAYDVNRIWKKDATWDRSAVIEYSTETRGVQVKDLPNDEKELTVPYCALYSVMEKDGKVEWNCSFKPWYMTKLQGYNYDAIKLNKDFALHLNFKKTPLPTKYLTYPEVSEKLFTDHQSLPVPVSVKMKYTSKQDNFSLLNGIYHYAVWISGKKEVVTQKVITWEVSEISTDWTKMTDTELQALLKNLEKGVDAHLSIKSIEDEEDTEYLDSLALMFKEQTYLCSTDSYYCDYDVEGNAGSNIIMYLYAQNRLGNKDFVDKFLAIARKKVSPFAEQYNKDFKIVYPAGCTADSTSDDCMGHYQDLQMYQYPICPIRELNEGNLTHANVSLFKEVMKLYAENNGGLLYKQSEIAPRLKAMENLAVEKLPIQMSSKNVIELNQLCYHAIAYGMTKDPAILASLNKADISLLATTFGTFKDESLAYTTPKSLNDLKQFVFNTKLQSTYFPLAPHERYHDEKLLEGLTNRDAMSELNYAVTSMPLSLNLIYLFAK